MALPGWSRLLDAARRAVGAGTGVPRTRRGRARGAQPPHPPGSGSASASGRRLLPDFTGTLHAEYAPALDGDADPGEIVWTWVPYEEDPALGKDRPVLVVGHDGPWILALMLSSKDHSRDAAREARRGRRWIDIGSGPWDARQRASEIRLDRVLRLDPAAVRREGAVLGRTLFDRVVDAL